MLMMGGLGRVEPGRWDPFGPAEMLGTVDASQGTVSAAPEAFRMAVILNLPTNQQGEGEQHHTGGKKGRNQNQRSGHHPRPPGKNPAIDTALVSHQKQLEGTEK